MGINIEAETDRQLSFMPDYVPVLLACSGGVDSVVLAHLLQSLGKNFALVHCNFRLRGDESTRDEELVQTLATTMGVPFYVRRFHTKAYAQQRGISIQMAARDLRYGYFEELMQSGGFHYVCTGHHLDDSLETLLLNFSRGTGLAGLTRIGHRDHILRPLQEVSKTNILAYAQKHKLTWREDGSNAKTDYRRNAIRHFVLTSWREAEKHLDSGARRSFHNLQSEKRALEHFLAEALQENLRVEDKRQILPLEKLRKAPYFEALLHYWLKGYGNFDYASILQLQEGAGQQFESREYRLLHHNGALILEPLASGHIAPVTITINTREILQPVFMRFEVIQEMRPSSIFKEGIAQLDYDKLQFPLILRAWQAGDAFVPMGMKGKKKLSDFFTDRKTDRWQKERTLVLCSGEDIVWVVGMRIAEPYKITQTTKNIYFVHLF